MSKKSKLKKKWPTIKHGKAWWRSLSPIDKSTFVKGFHLNKDAEKIQEEEIKLNIKRRQLKNI